MAYKSRFYHRWPFTDSRLVMVESRPVSGSHHANGWNLDLVWRFLFYSNLYLEEIERQVKSIGAQQEEQFFSQASATNRYWRDSVGGFLLKKNLPQKKNSKLSKSPSLGSFYLDAVIEKSKLDNIFQLNKFVTEF